MKVVAVLFVALTALSAFAQKHASVEQQKRCADQAQIYSRAQHANLTNRQYADLGELVTNHFDPVLEVCYVRTSLLMVSGLSVKQFDSVCDAFEGVVYASYSWDGWLNPDETKGQSNSSALSSCYVHPPKHGRVSCGSNDASKAASHKEFNLLVEKYVGVGAAIDEN
jgi:hypothetical protein